MGGRIAAVLGLALALPAPAAGDEVTSFDGVTVTVAAQRITIDNGVLRRTWQRDGFATVALEDLRPPAHRWPGGPDFRLAPGAGAAIDSTEFRAESVAVTRLARGGARVAVSLAPRGAAAPGLEIVRTIDAYPGAAAMRTATTLRSIVPMAFSAADVEQAGTGGGAPTIHAFRAGADWREPGWGGPQLAIGDAHAGDWVATRTAPAAADLSAPGEWISIRAGDGRTLALVQEADDLPSVRAASRGGRASVGSEWGRDLVSLGPLEEDAHVENPLGAGRMRTVRPGTPLVLAPAFTVLGRDAEDEAWQFHRALVDHRLAPYRHDVVFNTDGTDRDRISTGAKDDADLATVAALATVARRLGVETFVLDDGWQAASGDWQPDSPGHPEPRGSFPPRFPDATFAAVRAAIAPMRLGLWMSPLHFNPSSAAYRGHPWWACAPVGHALAVDNALQPGDGSNEAGIGEWSAAALGHVEARIADAIEHWDVRYFKFDFLAWLDCAGAGDLYEQHDAFVAMVDRLRAAHPDVTFQIDETNDYRLFPFESLARGPLWFQNGKPGPERLLHNLWTLSPWIPAFAIGQHALGGAVLADHPVDELMAAALPSHITFISDIRSLPAAVVDRAARWLRFYRRSRDLFSGVTFPLLEDPLRKGWTALQVWDPDRGRGALLAFRQDSAEPRRTVALRDVPEGRYRLVLAPSGRRLRTVGASELRRGISVRIPTARGARVLAITRTGGRR